MEGVCDNYIGDIAEFFDRVVDRPMCSDMCPCDVDFFDQGGYN